MRYCNLHRSVETHDYFEESLDLGLELTQVLSSVLSSSQRARREAYCG